MDNITILITTYKRYSFLLRLLKFYKSYYPLKLVVLDSSPEMPINIELLDELKRENVVWKKYGEEINRIIEFIQKADSDFLIDCIRSNKNIKMQDIDNNLEILPEEMILEEVSVDEYQVSTSKNLIVGVHTKISNELRDEGMVRDLIRQVQNLRKDSGLRVEDRIEIGIIGPEDLNNAIRSHKTYFMNEVLGVKLQMENIDSLVYNQAVNINGNKIIIGISPKN